MAEEREQRHYPRTYLFKTELCRNFTERGKCDYGDRCKFAHGEHDLRPRHFDRKYKTQLCRNYHETGECRFKTRCKFIHDEQHVTIEGKKWMVSLTENIMRLQLNEKEQKEMGKKEEEPKKEEPKKEEPPKEEPKKE